MLKCEEVKIGEYIGWLIDCVLLATVHRAMDIYMPSSLVQVNVKLLQPSQSFFLCLFTLIFFLTDVQKTVKWNGSLMHVYSIPGSTASEYLPCTTSLLCLNLWKLMANWQSSEPVLSRRCQSSPKHFELQLPISAWQTQGKYAGTAKNCIKAQVIAKTAYESSILTITYCGTLRSKSSCLSVGSRGFWSSLLVKRTEESERSCIRQNRNKRGLVEMKSTHFPDNRHSHKGISTSMEYALRRLCRIQWEWLVSAHAWIRRLSVPGIYMQRYRCTDGMINCLGY